MSTAYYKLRSIGRCLCLTGFAALLAAAPAGAAPVLDVELTRDLPQVDRSDERVDYTIKVTNIASGTPEAGDEVFCNGDEPPKNWFPGAPGDSNHPTKTFQWLRNGVVIPGEMSQTYTLTSADSGTVVQCVVTGTNENATTKYAAQPAVVVGPLPGTEPPISTVPTAAGSRPTVEGTGTAERTCQTSGMNWSGSPTFTFQWLRNGVPIPSATGEKYLPQGGVGQADQNKILQCEVIGSNAGGALVGISNNSVVGTVAQPPNLAVAQNPAVEFSNSASGVVTATLEMPASEQTAILEASGTGWACSAQPASGVQGAKAICTRSDVLAPGNSYPLLTVAVALGEDLPDTVVAEATASGGGALEVASDTDEFIFGPPTPFGITAFEARVVDAAGNDYTQAGGHPFAARARWQFATKEGLKTEQPIELVKQVFVDVPRGFVGNPSAVPVLCETVEDVLNLPSTCPPESVVGGIDIVTAGLLFNDLPIYAIEPEFGAPAELAFAVAGAKTTYTVLPKLRADDGYAISFELSPVPAFPPVIDSDVTLCGFGARTVEQPSLGTTFDGCKDFGDLDANPIPLITNPTRCEGPPPVTTTRVNSWENPDRFVEAESVAPSVTGCDKVQFDPTLGMTPTSNQADSPTGLDVRLSMPTNGLEGKDEEGNRDPEAVSQANLKSARVVFPEGMAINPAAGQGLAGCSSEQVKMGTDEPISCPDGSKIGTVAIETPLLSQRLTGAVYIAKQNDNPFDSMIGLYMVFESKRDGILIKIAGKVEPNPVTGQLVVTFDENPEAPFSSVELHFPGGPRATLITPPRCGTYEIKSELTPWNGGPAVAQTSTFQVTQGPNGGPCPTNALEPKLDAGVTNPTAGGHSPFVMRLFRDDGTQRFSGVSLKTPPGLTAELKGVPYCPEAAIGSISGAAGTGAAQIAAPSCPAASQIGVVQAGAGAGPNPFYVDTGKAYLAGPYKGAPLSMVLVTPAVAGPLDLGSVVVRTALELDPRTARITAVSDPIPTILQGLLLDIRDIRVAIDRPDFVVNPTNCEPMAVEATVRGADGATANVSNRFQVDGCAALGFKPRVRLSLKGGTKRGDNPALRAVVRPREGDANIARAAVTLPRSAFLDQGHIRTICTRVQFAADDCPQAAIYGRATAFTPLLDQPLRGPVYLRSSDNELPDMVAHLSGPAHQPIEIEAVFRIDSIRGGIRSTLDIAPDAPVSRFVLRMQGGKKGLVQNSQDLCARASRAAVRMDGHNGRRFNARPKVVPLNCKKSRSANRKDRARR
ncbi:MAG TPA: hypothetical protein VFY04_11375 [Solirubrobacterales bacterium]|nr:hypothetical protein [Solirubrobacterales bacterium]